MSLLKSCVIILISSWIPYSQGEICSYSCRQTYRTNCGWFGWGWETCTSYRYITCYRCCDGWIGSTDSRCPTPMCFGFTTCPKGGSCTRPDYCSNCDRGYYSPRCNSCTRITNCLTEFCSSGYDQKCDMCDGEYGPSYGSAYKKMDYQRQCIKQCSWRRDSNACYPGSCTNAQCRCTAGFDGTDCRTMDTRQAPRLSEHRATLKKGTTSLESPTVQGSTNTVYTNVRDFTGIQIVWRSSYQPTHLPAPGNIPYIQDVRLGVVSATVTVVVNRARTSPYSIVTSAPCLAAGSRDNPATALVTCDRTFPINYYSWTPANGDILRYDVTSVSGGYMKLYDRDNSNIIITRYYTGSTTLRYSTFTFDFNSPYHCVDVISGCRNNMLHAGDDITSEATITVTWEGWVDDLSGVKDFDLQVRQLSGSHGNQMTEILSTVYSDSVEPGQKITLPHVGVYSIVLTVVDNADNARMSRRFVFFDDNPNDVAVQQHHTYPMRVRSATPETNYEWITTPGTTRGSTPVQLDWMNHFNNSQHHNQGLLKPIGQWVISGSIDVDYDQNFGKRGRAAIPNALGITQFRVFHDIDHQGGRSIVNASDDNADNWSNETSNTRATYDLTLVDGDSIRFWVEARDIAGHFRRDSVLVHADTSPPIIEDFWLVRGNDVNIAIHNSVDLQDLSVEFRTYDIHSGVRTIEWRLLDNHTGSEVEHGSGTVAAVKVDQDNCDPVTCMCVPVGDCYNVDYEFRPTFHIGVLDFDYYIMVTVTNHARLVTSQTIKFTVDESPPQAGVVHDGIRGSDEVDFQEGSDLAAHWEGFFDRESGVKLYEYLFDVICWNDADKMPSIKDIMTNTTATHASWTAPSPGLYFITVIAYNRALEPSVPVCSDGVMIDTSPPELSNISISDARIWPGLAKDREGRVWSINEHRVKTELLNVSDVCRSKATMVSDITVYPGQDVLTDSFSIGEDINCQWTSGIQEKVFLPRHKHIILSWSGSDAESSIFDYEIGLSSDPSNPTPDLVNFMSASGHDHFAMFHPHISQGNVFFLVVKAVNKAQLAYSRFVGPIIVDTTRPMFVGRILVHLDGRHLVTEWGDDGFVDNEDADLAYQVGVGQTRGGTETVSLRSKKEYVIGPCVSRTSCAAFLLDDLSWYLHGDHEYYISVKAENGAGLSTVGTSSVYRHIMQLPSQGVVLDVAPSGEEIAFDFGIVKDVDVQMNKSRLSAQWFGFEHPHLDINYEVAVGTGREGSSDVSNGFIYVRNALSYQLDGLDLTPLMTYYFTVRATSESGSVNVTSDGIKVIPEGQVLEGTFITDGLGCDPAKNLTTPPGLSHHSFAPSQPCEDDVTYQASTSGVSARWTIPEMLQPFVTNVLWAVEQEIQTYHDVDTSSSEWITLLDYQDLGMAFNHLDASLGLHDGAHLRSKVRFCHVSVCFQPIISDGFWVLSKPPLVGEITINNIETDIRSTSLHVVFQPFAHAYIDNYRQLDLMDYYEWTIAEDGEDGAVLSEWNRIDDLLVNGDTANFIATFEGHLDHDTCLHLAIRGYNKAALSSIVSQEVVDCDDVKTIKPHVVIDSDHEVTLEQNALWPEADKDYISSTTVLSAVWPSLRHRNYVWAAIRDTGSAEFGDLDIGLNYPCDHPMAEGCGNTDKEYVNVHGLSLEHGNRYRICIHAEEVTLEHETWTEPLPSVSSCSDGVVVDMTPPTPGSVWIGWSHHNNYQRSTSELVIQWESFSDVEEHGLARHHSGIKYYEYAIGSMPGGSDVQHFTRVGITNSIIVHNLRLQHGHTYYAVIRATDFVGSFSTSMSEAIVIDTTPPTVSEVYTLDVGGSFLLSTTSVAPSWENVFTDIESGIAYFEWAVGSYPGHADVMPFIREDSESGVTDPSRPLTLDEGHSYFISIKAIDNVGLITLKAFGAFKVEESPPVAGHVLDGSSSLTSPNHKDRDFQEDRKTISAFWEGFHDPHSALVSYSWKTGTCKGCSDVMPEQHIGMDTEFKADNLHLVPGFTYYVTVTACNAADLCTSVTSDGVLVDDSSPLVGRVYDGSPGGGDISFQSSRMQLSAHWWGFHDPHSGLLHYEWRAGTTPGSSDILSSTRLELSESALIFLSESDQMLEDSDIYITVRVYNRVGLWSEATSNGFRVDSSPPQVIQEPAVDETVGVVVKNTQVLCDIIRFSWKFNDPESDIKDQYVSVRTHHNGDVNIPTLKVAGSEVDHTFTSLTLHEGSRYVITVVACNHAGLCTEAMSAEFLVDGSSSSVGAFAVGTEGATNMPEDTYGETSTVSATTPRPPRYHSGWMTWLEDTFTSTGSLALAWLGFADIHSGISHYFVSVGRTYGGSELTPSGPVRVNHNMSLEEGVAQTAIIPVEGSITDSNNHNLYVSLWAVNGVGLQSSRHHSTFDISETSPDEGALVLLRSCQSTSCEDRCTCAPDNDACSIEQGLCDDLTGNNTNTEIEVLDVVALNFDDINNLIDIDDTATRYMMAAIWRVSEQKGLSINWYEWSIGDDSSSDVEPTGVFDTARERVWFDNGQENHAIVMLDKDRVLTAGLRYHFYIRAWYDANTYAVFRSDGITADIMAPDISKVRGTKIKDLATSESSEDTDYLTDPDNLYLSWEGVFRDNEMSHYEVSLSTFKGGEDIRHFAENVLSASVSRTQFTGLGLQSGHRYYSNIRAFNKAGLHTLRSSDGFVVDLRKPDAGLVFDGIDLHDVQYQNSSTLISASWHGFTDLESYIDHYEWCVGRTPDPTDDGILPCTAVGMQLSASTTLSVPLTGGIRYYSIVSAIDAAGRSSDRVLSDGFVVDVTPPEPQKYIHSGDNFILNPSFERRNEPDIQEPMSTQMTETESTESPVVDSTTKAEEDSEGSPDEIAPWEVGSDTQITVVTRGNKIAPYGRSFLSLLGSISQTFNSTPGSHYRVLFFTSHVVPSREPLLNQEGRIEAPGLNRVFRLYSRPAGGHSDQSLSSIQWHEQRFYFTASKSLSTLRISSVGRSNGILLDSFQVTLLAIEPSNGQGSVDVHTQFIHNWSSLRANWHFLDPESPIIDYNWAIGTSLGGTQLQNFKSVGTQTDAINTELSMSHGSLVYVTVTAKNAADLTSVVTSDPILIDLTAPIIHAVLDGQDDVDIDFSSDDKSICLSWTASDPESGIDHCEWAIGLEPGLDNVSPRTVSTDSKSKIIANFTRALVKGQKLFATVKCFNNAGRSSWKSSDGVTIVTEPPSSLTAVVKVKAVSKTEYATYDEYQSQSNFLRASWEGFIDSFGIQLYQCRLTGPSYPISAWKRCGSASEEHLHWSDLTLEDDATYSLSVRAVNHADLISQAISQTFTVDTSKPSSKGSNLLTSAWHGNGTVNLSWDGMFISSSPLHFEVSLGTVLGGSDVMQWIETMNTGMPVSPLVPHTNYYLTVTAVNAAGLSQTAYFIDDGKNKSNGGKNLQKP